MVLDRSSTYTPTRGAQWFQNAVQAISDFSGKMSNPLWKENVHSSYRKTLPSCTISSLVPRDKNVYLRPSKTLTLGLTTINQS